MQISQASTQLRFCAFIFGIRPVICQPFRKWNWLLIGGAFVERHLDVS